MHMNDDGGLVSSKNQREPNWDEKINWFNIPDDNEVYNYRLVSRAFFYASHWVQTKKKDGTLGKSFPALCKNYDSKTNTYAENGCVICEFLDQVNKALETTKQKWDILPNFVKKSTRRKTMAHNVIIRELQHQGPPANNIGSWSFIVPMRFPQGFANTLAELQEKFNKKSGQVYALSHSTEGRDLLISYNSQAKDPGSMYQVQLGDKTVLTPDEFAHEKFLIDFGAHLKYPDQNDLQKSLARNGYYEWLENFLAQSNLATIQKASTPAPAPAPAAPAKPSAFDDTSTFKAEAEEIIPSIKPAAEAPVSTPAPTPAPAPALAQVAPQPQMATATPVAATGHDINSKILNFAQSIGIGLHVLNQEFPDVRIYQPTMQVPVCFTQYSATDKKICKQCPLKLDCMLTDAG